MALLRAATTRLRAAIGGYFGVTHAATGVMVPKQMLQNRFNSRRTPRTPRISQRALC
jgi:hypothetical protein